MKTLALVLLAAVLPLSLLAQEQEKKEEDPVQKRREALARFYKGEVDPAAVEIEGAWMLMEYLDPNQREAPGTIDGFALFHDGFMMLEVGIRTFDQRFLHVADVLLLQMGAYRYRLDAQGNLQLSSILGYTNFTESGDIEREPSGDAFEYSATLEQDVLELRTTEGVTFTFRRVTAGEFPASAARIIEGRRSRTPVWDEDQPPPSDVPRPR